MTKSNKLQVLISRTIFLFISYYYNIYYFFTNKDYFNTHHLEVTINPWYKLLINWYTHDQYIEHKKQIIETAKKGTEALDFSRCILQYFRLN